MPISNRTLALLLICFLTSSFLLAAPVKAQETQGEIVPIHFNMERDTETLSPGIDPEDEAIEAQPQQSHSSTPGTMDCGRGRDWVTIGTWYAPATTYDVSMGNSVQFNIWWMEDDQPTSCPGGSWNADAEFRWTLKLNDETDLATHTTGENNALEPTEVTGSANINNSTKIIKGDVISLQLEYRALERIFYYFDNATYMSGFTLPTNGLIPLAAEGRSSSVTLELVQAWPTDLQEALDGHYITAEMKGEFADNELAVVEEGREYQVNNATIKSEAITWTTPYPGQATISFSYAPNGTVEPVMIEVVTIPVKEEEGGFLPGLGFSGTLIAFAAISIHLSRRRV